MKGANGRRTSSPLDRLTLEPQKWSLSPPLEFNPSSSTQKLNLGKGKDDTLRRRSLPLAHTSE